MTSQMTERITKEYYSRFCGVNLSKVEYGTCFTCSAERNAELSGLGCRYTIYVLVKDGLCAAAYSPRHREVFDQLRKCSRDELLAALHQQYKLKKMQLMMFAGEVVAHYGNARILEAADYPLYEAFFREAFPGADPDGWLYEYFMEKSSKEYFTGYLMNGKLLSVCDAPDMPYMADKIQHTGIHTLKSERRKGYAACAAALAAHHLAERNICPQWECGAENIASIKLARSIGYIGYATAYVLEE